MRTATTKRVRNESLGAISTATACSLPGSVAEGIAVLPAKSEEGYSIEHPTGEFTV